MEKKAKTVSSIPMIMIKGLGISCLLTVIAAVIMAFLLWKTNITETILRIAVIVIYAIACFISGHYCGRKIKNRRFIWGLLSGLLYFAVLAVMTWTNGKGGLNSSLITSALVCLGCGMFGGMLG